MLEQIRSTELRFSQFSQFGDLAPLKPTQSGVHIGMAYPVSKQAYLVAKRAGRVDGNSYTLPYHNTGLSTIIQHLAAIL